MCELFAMSARHPTTISLSLEEFSRHGGLTGPHKDGWGIGWYEENDIRLVKERYPSASSACARFIQADPFSTSLVISHIRKATRGPVASRNCQPFVRELGPANFLYCDGDALFAHSDRRHQSDGSIRAPGMWRLARRCPAGGELAAEGLRIASYGGEQEVVLVASVALTAEAWAPLAEGELLVARQGLVHEE